MKIISNIIYAKTCDSCYETIGFSNKEVLSTKNLNPKRYIICPCCGRMLFVYKEDILEK